VTADTEGVSIVVEDDGPGVPPELRESIFEPFNRGDAPPDRGAGVGIGLALVARFAAMHGGRAWVQEREGRGASFRVWLPAYAPAEPDPSEMPPAPSQAPPGR
jgi:signal transduction histidine kinase